MVIMDNSHGSKCLEIIKLQPFQNYGLDVFIAKRGGIEKKKLVWDLFRALEKKLLQLLL